MERDDSVGARPAAAAAVAGAAGLPRALRLGLAHLLALLHHAIIAFFLVGWAAPWREVLWGVAAGAVVVHAAWWLLDDRCLLTLLEERLRGEEHVPAERLEDGVRQPNFIADSVTRLLGRPLPLHWINNATYAVLWTSFSLASLRLATGW